MSTSVKSLSWTLCAAMLFSVGAWRARADALNKQTFVTFSGPVEIPGKVLPAGTYQFRLVNGSANPDIVQILNKDGTEAYATLLTVQDYRANPTGHAVIHFEERPSGTPDAIKSWFYPGDNYGNQFVYPQTEAAEIARRTHQDVLSMRDEMKDDINAPASTGNEASVQALSHAKVSATTPEGNQVDMNQVVKSKQQ